MTYKGAYLGAYSCSFRIFLAREDRQPATAIITTNTEGDAEHREREPNVPILSIHIYYSA